MRPRVRIASGSAAIVALARDPSEAASRLAPDAGTSANNNTHSLQAAQRSLFAEISLGDELFACEKQLEGAELSLALKRLAVLSENAASRSRECKICQWFKNRANRSTSPLFSA